MKSQAKCRHAKSASRCPAVLDLEARYFEIPCPFDLYLRMDRAQNGQWTVRNLADETSGLRPGSLKRQLHMVNQGEWRHPERPMLQIMAPYRFISDDVVYVTQCEPFMDFGSRRRPGMVFGGRFPTHVWPRSLMWAFEWYDLSQPLMIKRGDPWFYVHFETTDPTRKVRMVEATKTPDLEQYTNQIDGVANYVNQTFSLFERAESVRPKKLLVERT